MITQKIRDLSSVIHCINSVVILCDIRLCSQANCLVQLSIVGLCHQVFATHICASCQTHPEVALGCILRNAHWLSLACCLSLTAFLIEIPKGYAPIY